MLVDGPKALQQLRLVPADPSMAALVASPEALQGLGDSHSRARVGKLGGNDPWASLYASRAGMHWVLLRMVSDYALLVVLQVVCLQAGSHCAPVAGCRGAAAGH